MKALLVVALAAVCVVPSFARKYDYSFRDVPVSEALVRISKAHPDARISFIYKELDSYRTSARVAADNAYEAVRQAVGLNPVSVVKRGNEIYVEALQRGRYAYTGRVEGPESEALPGATVMLLAPKDSTVITYGLADSSGRFRIPCDRTDVLAKVSCMGYATTYRRAAGFDFGIVRLAAHPVVLDSVRVEASSAYALTDRTVFVPTARQKDAASGATDLLLRMAIPQIDVNPLGTDVKTQSGADVAIFIDYVEATPRDLTGMLTKDVRKVEYYAFSRDPRFKGADYVINFIMQRYEWGGYTRLSADQWFGVDRSEGTHYSKMAYRKMAFDVAGGGIHFASRHGGSDQTELFRFTDFHGAGPREIQRRSYAESYRNRWVGTDVSLRAVYSDDATQFSNSLSLATNANLRDDLTSVVEYPGGEYPSASATTDRTSRDYAITYTGDLFRQFSPALSLQADASYVYGRNALGSRYQLGNLAPIVNDARERTHSLEISPRLVWTLREKHRLTFWGQGQWDRNAIDYSGNSPSRQVYTMGAVVGGVNYSISLSKVRLGAGFTWAWETIRVSGHPETNTFPLYEFNALWTPSARHQTQISFSTGRRLPWASRTSPNMLRQDELMWYAGSPDLKDNERRIGRFSYTFLPANTWNLGVSAQYYGSMNRITAVYLPDAPEGAMLRKYMNSGNYHAGMVGLNASVRLFGGKFSLQVRPQMWMRRSTGVYNLVNNEFAFIAVANAYFGPFSIMAFFNTASNFLDEDDGAFEHSPSRYLLNVSWQHGPWRVGATAYNFLRADWQAERRTLRSQYYDYDRTDFGTGFHQRFSISATYTLSYGKKVSTSNEVNRQGTAGSAILK